MAEPQEEKAFGHGESNVGIGMGSFLAEAEEADGLANIRRISEYLGNRSLSTRIRSHHS